MDRYLSENGLLEAMDTWPKYGYMPDGRLIRLTKENEENYVPYVHYDDMMKVVKGIPSADVVPVVHAHWIEEEDCMAVTDIPWSMCSVCGSYSLKLPYCAFCGAKMDEEMNG